MIGFQEVLKLKIDHVEWFQVVGKQEEKKLKLLSRL
jgi:hypothetical protein